MAVVRADVDCLVRECFRRVRQIVYCLSGNENDMNAKFGAKREGARMFENDMVISVQGASIECTHVLGVLC